MKLAMMDLPENGSSPRRRGRPVAEQPLSVTVTACLRPSEYDRLVRLATLQDRSVSSLVRSLLMLRIR